MNWQNYTRVRKKQLFFICLLTERSQQKQHGQTQYGPREINQTTETKVNIILSTQLNTVHSASLFFFSISTAKPINFHKLKRLHSDWCQLENNRVSSSKTQPRRQSGWKRSKAATLRNRFYSTECFIWKGDLVQSRLDSLLLAAESQQYCSWIQNIFVPDVSPNYHIIYISLMAPLHAEGRKEFILP